MRSFKRLTSTALQASLLVIHTSGLAWLAFMPIDPVLQQDMKLVQVIRSEYPAG